MRIRKAFAGAFAVELLVAGYVGLAPENPIPTAPYPHSDKVLHLLTFFCLTLTFYWIVETSRRRAINLTLTVCTLLLTTSSEFLQPIVAAERLFDYLDIVANVIGSLIALGLCAWYHRRMIERKRAAKGYRTALTDEEAAEDLELGQGTSAQQTGVAEDTAPEPNIDEELDNWDENVEDGWDEEEAGKGEANGKVSKPAD